MTGLGFDHVSLLFFGPIALAPFLWSILRSSHILSLLSTPYDPLSRTIEALVKLLGALRSQRVCWARPDLFSPES